jgi:hypothetical protein
MHLYQNLHIINLNPFVIFPLPYHVMFFLFLNFPVHYLPQAKTFQFMLKFPVILFINNILSQ